MIFKISSAAVISFLFVFIVHSLYNYLQDSLTTPKTKDFVDIPEREYKNIYKTIKRQKSIDVDSETNTGFKNVAKSTKDELKQYFKQLNKTTDANEKESYHTFEDVTTSLSYVNI